MTQEPVLAEEEQKLRVILAVTMMYMKRLVRHLREIYTKYKIDRHITMTQRYYVLMK